MTSSKKLENLRKREDQIRNLQSFNKQQQREHIFQEWQRVTDKNYDFRQQRASASEQQNITFFKKQLTERRERLRELLKCEERLLRSELAAMKHPTQDIIKSRLQRLREQRLRPQDPCILDSERIRKELDHQLTEKQKLQDEDRQLDELYRQMTLQEEEQMLQHEKEQKQEHIQKKLKMREEYEQYARSKQVKKKQAVDEKEHEGKLL